MTHQDVENLASDYLEGLLAPGQRAGVDAHLAGCGACRELVEDVRHALEICRFAEHVEPPPWLLAKIVQATAGDRKTTWRAQLAHFLHPFFQPAVVYPIAMTVFTFSIIVNAAGLNLRRIHWDELNPGTWLGRANRHGHLLMARAEKYYYDLRVVYELESRFRQFSNDQQLEEETPKPAAPAGGTSQKSPAEQTTASSEGSLMVLAANDVQVPAQSSDPAVNGEIEGGVSR